MLVWPELSISSVPAAWMVTGYAALMTLITKSLLVAADLLVLLGRVTVTALAEAFTRTMSLAAVRVVLAVISTTDSGVVAAPPPPPVPETRFRHRVLSGTSKI